MNNNRFDQPLEAISALPRWPHQVFALEETFRLIGLGARRILITSPTGGGKSLILFDIALAAMRDFGWGVTLFANRKMLIEQITRSLRNLDVYHGVRAASHSANSWEPFQVASIQTEYSRVVKRKTLAPHRCGIFLIDEAHLNEGKSNKRVYQEYLAMGAIKIGVTATPLGLQDGYDVLVQAGTISQLRECGALVRADHFGCTEPDLRNIKRIRIGEDLTDPENVKLIMVPGIHGKVIHHYRRLNPQGLPSIGFGPGVAEGFGFAEAFVAAGIPAAHIDGCRIWINGEWMPSTEENRDKLLYMSKTGQIRIVWSRFVLREAVDMPWLRHGILATVFGSLQSYLQSGGRLLRSCPPVGKDSVTVQDHGGNWWRHGSLNSDRIWRLSDTNKLMAQLRQDAIAPDDNKPNEPEPFLCKECNQVLILRNIMRNYMATCPRCGHEMDFRRRSRPVIQANGELVEHQGNIFVRRRTEIRHDTAAKWKNYYWRARNSNMTFAQTAGLFFHENGYYPPRTLTLMPDGPQALTDWYLPVKKVPRERIKQENRKEDNA